MSFDVKQIALHGRHLIEASAGTGKTYNIANLFLRLLLEPHPSQPDHRPLAINQILVVTFTNAATDELRGRIRRKIEDALEYFRTGSSEDPFIRAYVPTDREAACQRLYEALLLVDEAPIYTIHAFATRTLQCFLFETGALADVEIVLGQTASEKRAFGDLMRRLMLGEEKKLGYYLQQHGMDVGKYMAGMHRLLDRGGLVLKDAPVSADQLIRDYEQRKQDLLHERAACFANAVYLESSIAAFRSGYTGKVTDAQIKSAIKYVNKNLSGSTAACKDPADGYTGAVTALEVTDKSQPMYFLQKLLLNAIAFNKNEGDFKAHRLPKQAALAGLLKQIDDVADSAVMNPDAVIRLINRKLDDKRTAEQLRQSVTAQYPVCMVDEFQDTDPEQFRLFDRLYDNEDRFGFYAIGDPKQSIYGFRGADIFAYLDVKARTHPANIHTLDTNYRSTAAVMRAVNALFCERQEKPVFIYEGMTYREIHPGQDKGVLCLGQQPAEHGLLFIGHEGDYMPFNQLLELYAEDCAERIVRLLQGEQAASIDRHGELQALKPGDIAVLVRNYGEASQIKRALRKRRLQAVYMAQKDSVFTSCIFAKDLLFVLRAMDEPASKRAIKAALATPLFRGFSADCSDLDAVEQHDGFFEDMVARFSGYRKAWDQHGIMRALQLFMSDVGLAAAFAQHPDRDRLTTDFRHLGDLLQQQQVVCDSRELLIDWYAGQLNDDSGMDEESKSLRLESDADLIKIVTLHGCKGLEYPVVFMPFFFGARDADLAQDPPLYHQPSSAKPGWEAVLDFRSPEDHIRACMQQERLAEDMRLLYVGITRAVYCCYIGISSSYRGIAKNPLFAKSVWPHLLGIADEKPDWPAIRSALQKRLADSACVYETLLPEVTVYSATPAARAADVLPVPAPVCPASAWLITSYSSLAHQKEEAVFEGAHRDDDEVQTDVLLDEEADKHNIRYQLPGSNITGDFFHKVFERIAHHEQDAKRIIEEEFSAYGLHQHEEPETQAQVSTWIHEVLATVLPTVDVALGDILAGTTLPEMRFDYALGSDDVELSIASINTVLTRQCGTATGITRRDHRQQLHGIMNGSMDLFFIHNKKVFVLDYKSNTLGKSPRFYDRPHMDRAMQEHHFDLQYLIYSVAAHRYMRQRLGSRYAFDGGEYSFGGVFYLFLRGMGLTEYPGHGVWFHRPECSQIEALDAIFRGEVVLHD